MPRLRYDFDMLYQGRNSSNCYAAVAASIFNYYLLKSVDVRIPISLEQMIRFAENNRVTNDTNRLLARLNLLKICHNADTGYLWNLSASKRNISWENINNELRGDQPIALTTCLATRDMKHSTVIVGTEIPSVVFTKNPLRDNQELRNFNWVFTQREGGGPGIPFNCINLNNWYVKKVMFTKSPLYEELIALHDEICVPIP